MALASGAIPLRLLPEEPARVQGRLLALVHQPVGHQRQLRVAVHFRSTARKATDELLPLHRTGYYYVQALLGVGDRVG